MAYRTRLPLSVLFSFSLLVVFAPPRGVRAQGLANTKSTTAKPTGKTKSVKREEADADAAQRRVMAISLLTSLADEVRSFKDEALRARVLARTADALWDTDTERARALFRRAWEAAAAADADYAEREAADARQQQST